MTDRHELEQRLDKAEWVLNNAGFRRCDIAACNCGSWHQVGGFKARFDEIKEAVEEADYSTNGKTLLDVVKEIIAEAKRTGNDAQPLPERVPVKLTEGAHRLWMAINGHDINDFYERAEYIIKSSLDGLQVGPSNRASVKALLVEHFEQIAKAASQPSPAATVETPPDWKQDQAETSRLPRHHLDASKWTSKAAMEASHARLSADSAREALASIYPLMDSLEAFRGEKDILRISGLVGDAQDVGIASIETTRKAIEAAVRVLEACAMNRRQPV